MSVTTTARTRWLRTVLRVGVAMVLVDWLAKVVAVAPGPGCDGLADPMTNKEFMLGAGSGTSALLAGLSFAALLAAASYG